MPLTPAGVSTDRDRGLGAWRLAVLATFLASGLAISAWLTRLPAIADRLDLGPGPLGLVLLTQTMAAFASVSTSGMTVMRLGAKRTLQIFGTLVVLGLVVLGVGVSVFASLPLTVAGLLLFGLGAATWNVAGNVEGTALEAGLGRSIMPFMHAFFSIGTVLGAIVGTGMAAADVPVGIHTCAMALVILVLIWGAVPFFQGDRRSRRTVDASGAISGAREPMDPVSSQIPVITGSMQAADARGQHRETSSSGGRQEQGSAVSQAWRDRRTLLVGVFVLGMALTEGAANDWAALALTQGYGASDSVGAVGYGMFVTAMTTGRLLGTWMIDRFGRVPVLRTACLLALVGLGTFVVSPWLPLGLAALLLWGLGASLGFPVGMSAAADDPVRQAANVSVVSTIGYAAFLGGPPMLGLLGELLGVRGALAAVLLLILVSLALVPWLRPLDEQPRRAAA